MFFGKFDKIQYKGKTVTNITNSILLKYRPMNNTTLYTYHTVKEGETPEILAHKYYGKAEDHWIILLLNNIVNPFFDWVLTSQELSSLITDKYGKGNEGKIHHLVYNKTGKWVDDYTTMQYVDKHGGVIKPIPFDMSPVTNSDVEIERNNSKRDVKILAPQYVQDFKNQFEDLMSGEGIN